MSHFLEARLISISALAIASLLTMSAGHATTTWPVSFAQRQVRYLSPPDLIVRFRQVFPGAEWGDLQRRCFMLTPQNRPLLGDNQLVTGEPALQDPAFGFVIWSMRCLTDMAKATFDPASAREFADAYGDGLATWRAAHRPQGFASTIAWRDVPPEVQSGFLRFQTEKMVGPEAVIQDFAQYPTMEAFITDRYEGALRTIETPEPSLSDVAVAFAVAVGITDEFLSY